MRNRNRNRIILVIIMILGLVSCGMFVNRFRQQDSDEFQQQIGRMELVTRMRLSTIALDKPIRASGILLRQDEKSSLLLIAGHSARHVRKNGSSVATSATGVSCSIRITAVSDRYDLGLARAQCRLPGIPARLAPRPVELGETVYVLGHTLGEPYTLTKGIASNLRRVVDVGGRPGVFLQVDANSLVGNSGGPVFNTKGKVIGVVIGGFYASVYTPFGRDPMRRTKASHMTLCVPLQHIRNFLSRQGAL